MFMACLPRSRRIYLDLGRSEDVLLALSVLRQTYLDLKRSEDVLLALSVLRWT